VFAQRRGRCQHRFLTGKSCTGTLYSHSVQFKSELICINSKMQGFLTVIGWAAPLWIWTFVDEQVGCPSRCDGPFAFWPAYKVCQQMTRFVGLLERLRPVEWLWNSIP
jgi:hypothetical protein